jgi:hypothetical protein
MAAEAMKLRRLWISEIFARFNLAAGIDAAVEIKGYGVGDAAPPQRAFSAPEREIVAAAA